MNTYLAFPIRGKDTLFISRQTGRRYLIRLAVPGGIENSGEDLYYLSSSPPTQSSPPSSLLQRIAAEASMTPYDNKLRTRAGCLYIIELDDF